jgi:hypothetical protein
MNGIGLVKSQKKARLNMPGLSGLFVTYYRRLMGAGGGI